MKFDTILSTLNVYRRKLGDEIYTNLMLSDYTLEDNDRNKFFHTMHGNFYYAEIAIRLDIEVEMFNED